MLISIHFALMTWLQPGTKQHSSAVQMSDVFEGMLAAAIPAGGDK
jgi:hypothetical protein